MQPLGRMRSAIITSGVDEPLYDLPRRPHLASDCPASYQDKGAPLWPADIPASPPERRRRGMTRLYRIVAPHFVAGVVIGGPAAPIVGYMARWSAERIRRYCGEKLWVLEELPGFRD